MASRFLRLLRFFVVSALTLSLVVCLFPRVGTFALAQFFPTVLFHQGGTERSLTIAIDDGPDPDTTLRIGEILLEAEIYGTFFLIGERVERDPDIVSTLHSQGHQIGAHFFEDAITALLSKDEAKASLTRTLALMPDDLAIEFARPGYGIPSYDLLQVAQSSDLTLVIGDLPAFDTLGLPDWFYLSYLRLAARHGSIVTFHDVGRRGARTIETLPKFIKWAKGAGYRFVTLNQTGSNNRRPQAALGVELR